MFKSRDERSQADTKNALSALKKRRDWIIGQLARDKIGVTGGALQADVDKHAQALFFVDQALRILSEDKSPPGVAG